jgi:transposase
MSPPASPPPPSESRPARVEWDAPIRIKVFNLLTSGKGIRQIARQTGVPPSTISRWRKAGPIGFLTEAQRPDKHRTGRPFKLSKDDVKRLVETARRDYNGQKVDCKKLAKDCGLDVSRETVKRALKRNGFNLEENI